jgi:hypothetical protein
MKNSFKYIRDIDKVQELLNDHGLNHIELKVEVHPNDYDKKVPHLVAYNPKDLIVEVSDEVDETNTRNLVFSEGQTCKFEELNKYFSAELFAMGITQRADYLKAPLWVKEYCYRNNIHPAQYRPGMVVGTIENA